MDALVVSDTTGCQPCRLSRFAYCSCCRSLSASAACFAVSACASRTACIHQAKLQQAREMQCVAKGILMHLVTSANVWQRQFTVQMDQGMTTNWYERAVPHKLCLRLPRPSWLLEHATLLLSALRPAEQLPLPCPHCYRPDPALHSERHTCCSVC